MPIGSYTTSGGIRRLLSRFTEMHIPPGRTTLLLSRLDEAESERIHGDRSGRFEQRIAQQHRRDNRWADILTFDHSLLPGEYLNAALIPPIRVGKATRSYIASQAPLPHTLTTFYRHAIDQGVGLIVNLTPFEERGRCKSDAYWPARLGDVQQTDADEGGFKISQIKAPVQLDKFLKATRYSIQVTPAKASQQASEHRLTILHVTGWADFGDFPEDVFENLLGLIETEERVVSSPNAPIWVHCSAGVGRSGTVIASMLARDMGESISSAFDLRTAVTPATVMEASLQITYEIIDHTRQYRPRMVQTADQVAMVANVVARRLQT